MNNPIRIAAAALSMSLATALPSLGGVIDPLDTADGFNDSFGGTTAVANGDGTVTLTRNTANVDAGINWTDMGSKVVIGSETVLKVTPSAAVNGGYYGINILFFDAADQYVSENVWISDTNSTDVQELADIVAFAADPGVASFVLRFRIQPFDQAGAAFTFDKIEFGTSTTLVGDINGDGFVGIADLNMVLGNWNAGTPPTGGSPSIPEPASMVLLGLGGLTLLRRRSA
jgi:MYXO-CTERM domain-containing protein